MPSTYASSPSLAKDASEIGWNLLEATFRKDAILFDSVMRELRRLLSRVEEISGYLRDRPSEGGVPVAANKLLKRLLANHPREKHSEIFVRLDPPTRALRVIVDKAGPEGQLPSREVLAEMKLQVANLTGHLSKADI